MTIAEYIDGLPAPSAEEWREAFAILNRQAKEGLKSVEVVRAAVLALDQARESVNPPDDELGAFLELAQQAAADLFGVREEIA